MNLLIYLLLLVSFFQTNVPSNLYRNLEEGQILNLYDAFSKDSNLIKDFDFLASPNIMVKPSFLMREVMQQFFKKYRSVANRFK